MFTGGKEMIQKNVRTSNGTLKEKTDKNKEQ
jgi:hypothetical protein